MEDGTVNGVPPKAASDMVENVIEVHSYEKITYDRVNDADVKVIATVGPYIFANKVFTE